MAKRVPPDDRRCTAKSKSTGERCLQPRHKQFNVCRFHGGRGAEASYIHGRNPGNKCKPLPLLQERVEEVRAHWKEPKSLRVELEHLRAIYLSRLRTIEQHNAAKLNMTAEEIVREKIAELRRFVEIGQIIRDGNAITQEDRDFVDSFRVTEELSAKDARAIASLIDMSSKTVERMCKIEDGLKVTVSIPELGGLVSKLKAEIRSAIKEELGDEAAERVQHRLNDRFGKLALEGRGSA